MTPEEAKRQEKLFIAALFLFLFLCGGGIYALFYFTGVPL